MQSNCFNDKSIGSFILLPEILEIFQKIKIPKSDLSKLRTISMSYCNIFGTIYLKRLSLNFTIEQLEPKRQAQVLIRNKKGKAIKIISDENLDKLMDCGYMFHKISTIVYRYELPEAIEQLDPIILSLGPNISELDLGSLPVSSCPRQSTILIYCIKKLIKYFINLKKIIFNCDIDSIYLEQFKAFLANISSNIQIHLSLVGGEKKMDDAFLVQSNLFLLIRIWGAGERLLRFEIWLKKYKQFELSRIKFDVDIEIITVEEMIKLTKICLENKTCIYKLNFQLRLDPQILLTIEEQAALEECLLKLSGMVNGLTLTQISDVKLDLLRGIPTWPKLTHLHIQGYEHRLDILKRCPKLRLLIIGGVNWDSYSFHNPQNTEKEDLKEYFGHLKKIIRIGLYGLGEEVENIKAKLKQIVPPNTGFWHCTLFN